MDQQVPLSIRSCFKCGKFNYADILFIKGKIYSFFLSLGGGGGGGAVGLYTKFRAGYRREAARPPVTLNQGLKIVSLAVFGHLNTF